MKSELQWKTCKHSLQAEHEPMTYPTYSIK